jgi:hypothetical protein
MYLMTYSSDVSQGLHMAGSAYVPDSMITTSDVEVQQLYVQVYVAVYYDACRKLIVGPDARLLIEILPDMLMALRIDPDVVQHLFDSGYASTELAIGPDAFARVELSLTERGLRVGPQAEAQIQIMPDGSAQISISPDCLVKLQSGGGGKVLQVGPDAIAKLIIDVCGD